MTPEEAIDLLRQKCSGEISKFKAATSLREKVAALASFSQMYGAIRTIAIQNDLDLSQLEKYEKAIHNMIGKFIEE